MAAGTDSTTLTLSKAEQKKLQAQLTIIDNANEGIINSIVDIGRALIAVQEVVEGSFVEWVEANCLFGKSSAYRYIKAANAFGSFPKLGNFQDSALMVLADCPAAAVEAKALANKGKRITHAMAVDMVADVRRALRDEENTVDEAPTITEETNDARAALVRESISATDVNDLADEPEDSDDDQADESDDSGDEPVSEVTPRAQVAKAVGPVEPNVIGFYRGQIADALDGIGKHPNHVAVAIAEYLRELADELMTTG